MEEAKTLNNNYFQIINHPNFHLIKLSNTKYQSLDYKQQNKKKMLMFKNLKLKHLQVCLKF